MIRFLVCSAPSFLIPQSVNKMRRIFAQRSLGPGPAKLALEEFRDGISARLEFGEMVIQSLKGSQHVGGGMCMRSLMTCALKRSWI
mmetsp:Transcript_19793/g.78850  ORF Transcript_19793/g.78850 Transcript_19793/m.78850 type:complete len:86 (-) Transcript_19793:4128-4385(-)